MIKLYEKDFSWRTDENGKFVYNDDLVMYFHQPSTFIIDDPERRRAVISALVEEGYGVRVVLSHDTHYVVKFER